MQITKASLAIMTQHDAPALGETTGAIRVSRVDVAGGFIGVYPPSLYLDRVSDHAAAVESYIREYVAGVNSVTACATVTDHREKGFIFSFTTLG